MSTDRLVRVVRQWLRHTEAAPPDARQSARQVMARLPYVRQRSRWWPLPTSGRGTSSGPFTSDREHRSAAIPETTQRIRTETGRTRAMFTPVKAIVAGALIFTLLGVLSIAQPFEQQGATAPAGGAAEGTGAPAPATIGFATLGTGEGYLDALAQGVRQAADAAGVTLLTGDGGWDGEVQAGQVEDFVTQGVGAIVLLAGDPAQLAPAIEAADAAGIPVVAVEWPYDGVTSLVASEDVAGARMAGEYLFEAMGGSGTIIAVEMDESRAEGFKQALDAAPSITLAAQGLESDIWSLLSSHPDVTGVFATDDYSALEVAVALAAQGLADKVTVVSVDGTPDGLAAVQRGTLAATAAGQPMLVGRTALETAIKAAAGEPVEAFVPVEMVLVTSANVDQFLAPTAPLPSPANE